LTKVSNEESEVNCSHSITHSIKTDEQRKLKLKISKASLRQRRFAVGCCYVCWELPGGGIWAIL